MVEAHLVLFPSHLLAQGGVQVVDPALADGFVGFLGEDLFHGGCWVNYYNVRGGEDIYKGGGEGEERVEGSNEGRMEGGKGIGERGEEGVEKGGYNGFMITLLFK